MAQPVYECTATNSCPGRPASQGIQDPIHNYMVRPRVPTMLGLTCRRRGENCWVAVAAWPGARLRHCALVRALPRVRTGFRTMSLVHALLVVAAPQ